MDFDFYQLFKDHSNTELLIIVKKPADYQPTAVAAAQQILSEREVTTDEIESVDQHFVEIDKSVQAKKELLDTLKIKTADFLEPLLHPSEEVQPNKWVNILLLVIAIQYSWLLFNVARRLITFLQCNYCSFDVFLLAELFTLLYVPLTFFLLYKRRRWGWILLFADNLFSLILGVAQAKIFFKYQSIHNGDTVSFLLPILIRGAFVFFLWRELIANHFGVTLPIKRKAAIVTACSTLLFMFIIRSL